MLETFAVLVIGRGKLAEELLQNLGQRSSALPTAIAQVLAWDKRNTRDTARCIVVHAGSGREYAEAVQFCSSTGSILLELSTNESSPPSSAAFPLIVCPNVNLQMLYFMATIKYAARFFGGQSIRLTESHQATKSTKPGTALYLGHALGLSETDIRSERDPAVQEKELGIPASYLGRHAYHQILIGDGDVELRFESRVLGKSAYASGLEKIIEMIARRDFTPGVYDVVDLILDETPLC